MTDVWRDERGADAEPADSEGLAGETEWDRVRADSSVRRLARWVPDLSSVLSAASGLGLAGFGVLIASTPVIGGEGLNPVPWVGAAMCLAGALAAGSGVRARWRARRLPGRLVCAGACAFALVVAVESAVYAPGRLSRDGFSDGPTLQPPPSESPGPSSGGAGR